MAEQQDIKGMGRRSVGRQVTRDPNRLPRTTCPPLRSSPRPSKIREVKIRTKDEVAAL